MLMLALGATLLNVYAVTLVVCRAVVFRVPMYRPMLWNIWLSVLPIVILLIGGIGGLVLTLVSRPFGYGLMLITAVVWILMLPNASYLITELNQSHRREEEQVPLWYDIILVITLAMSGVINTMLNILIVHFIVAITLFGDSAQALTEPVALLLVVSVMLLLSFGMYLGRYPRFNSWDLKHPTQFLKKFRNHFSVRANCVAALGFTITYAVFLALIYVVVVGQFVENLLGIQTIRDALLG